MPLAHSIRTASANLRGQQRVETAIATWQESRLALQAKSAKQCKSQGFAETTQPQGFGLVQLQSAWLWSRLTLEARYSNSHSPISVEACCRRGLFISRPSVGGLFFCADCPQTRKGRASGLSFVAVHESPCGPKRTFSSGDGGPPSMVRRTSPKRRTYMTINE
jgi:hypothetical protein